MKENEWRTKLVQQFKQNKPNSFIWVNSSKFVSGFPDLYLIDQETGIGRHIELKVFSSTNGVSLGALRKFFDPIQISVMRSINIAGGSAIGMALNKATLNVYLFDPVQDIMFILKPDAFKRWWVQSNHSWVEAEES